ncbi:unnamed protein product [Amoebophrya sp. A120]|nr:unnamed protein product [Amoebophrya sp. A120]|eukprot:GSA120T00003125001.1
MSRPPGAAPGHELSMELELLDREDENRGDVDMSDVEMKTPASRMSDEVYHSDEGDENAKNATSGSFRGSSRRTSKKSSRRCSEQSQSESVGGSLLDKVDPDEASAAVAPVRKKPRLSDVVADMFSNPAGTSASTGAGEAEDDTHAKKDDPHAGRDTTDQQLHPVNKMTGLENDTEINRAKSACPLAGILDSAIPDDLLDDVDEASGIRISDDAEHLKVQQEQAATTSSSLKRRSTADIEVEQEQEVPRTKDPKTQVVRSSEEEENANATAAEGQKKLKVNSNTNTLDQHSTKKMFHSAIIAGSKEEELSAKPDDGELQSSATSPDSITFAKERECKDCTPIFDKAGMMDSTPKTAEPKSATGTLTTTDVWKSLEALQNGPALATELRELLEEAVDDPADALPPLQDFLLQKRQSLQSHFDDLAKEYSDSLPALGLFCGSPQTWTAKIQHTADAKQQKRLIRKFQDYAQNFPDKAATVVRELGESPTWLPIPECCHYDSAFFQDPEVKQLFADLEKAKIAQGSAQQAKVNTKLLPELRKANRAFARAWVGRNKPTLQWIEEGPPDLEDPAFRTVRLSQISELFRSMPLFTLHDYNRVFMRKEPEELKEVVKAWVENPDSPDRARSLLFLVLNLLRRRESWDAFLEVLQAQVLHSDRLRDFFLDVVTCKGLFYITSQHADEELRAKLLIDFASTNPVPLVYPTGEVNPFVYHVLRESVGVFSFAVGSEAAQPATGKTQLVNDLLGTEFNVSRRPSVISFGTVDVDTGASFQPDRNLTVFDAHGLLDPRFFPMLKAAAHIVLVHINAQELQHQPAAFVSSMEALANARAEWPEPKQVFLLIRDAVSEDLSEHDAKELCGRFFGQADVVMTGSGGDRASPSAAARRDSGAFRSSTLEIVLIPDLRDAESRLDLRNFKWYNLRPRILAAVTREIDLLRSVSGDERKKLMRRHLTQKKFVDSVLEPFSPAPVHRSYALMNQLIGDFATELKRHANDFYGREVVPVRYMLRELRDVERTLYKNFDSGMEDELTAAKQARERLCGELKRATLSPLLQLFLRLLSQPNAVTIVSEVAWQLKLFVERNTKAELSEREALRRNANRAGGENAGAGKALEDLSNSIDRKTCSIEVLFRELSFLCEYTERFLFDLEPSVAKMTDESAGERSHSSGKASNGSNSAQKRNNKRLLDSPTASGASASSASPSTSFVSRERANPIEALQSFVGVGEPFEMIDGDNLKFAMKTLEQVFHKFDGRRVFVLSVLGPQSSGKSTLLNFLFGSKFGTGTGRCTKGIYANLINIEHEHYDAILVLDTEGLQSVEKDDEEFDRKITLFCLAVSHLVVVNIKGDMHSSMKKLLEICVLALDQLRKARMGTPHVQFVFNQNSNAKKNPFAKQIEDITSEILNARPDAHDVARIMQVSDPDLFVLSFAWNLRSVEKNADQGQMEDWCQSKPVSQFAVEVNQIARRMTQIMSEKEDALKKSEHQTKHFKHLLPWLEMASNIWCAIEANPELVSFADLKHMKDDRDLKQKATEWEREFLKDKQAEQEQLVHRLVDSQIDKGKIYVRNYVESQLATVQQRIREYFDGVYASIEKRLGRVALEKDYRKQLVDVYKRNLRGRVDQYQCEVLNKCYTTVQGLKAEVGRSTGHFEIEQAMRKMLQAADPTEAGAENEFDRVWDDMITKREQELNVEEMEGQLFDHMKTLYRQEQQLPAKFTTNLEFQDKLRRLAGSEASMRDVSFELNAEFFSKFTDVLKPRIVSQHYNKMTPQSLQVLHTESTYLRVLDYFEPVKAVYAFEVDPDAVSQQVQWDQFLQRIDTIFNSFDAFVESSYERAKQRLAQLNDCFDDLCVCFETDFFSKLNGLMAACRYWEKPKITYHLRNIIGKYTCLANVCPGIDVFPIRKLSAPEYRKVLQDKDHPERQRSAGRWTFITGSVRPFGEIVSHCLADKHVDWAAFKGDIERIARAAKLDKKREAIDDLQCLSRYFQAHGWFFCDDFWTKMVAILDQEVHTWPWATRNTHIDKAKTLVQGYVGTKHERKSHPLVPYGRGTNIRFQRSDVPKLPCAQFLRNPAAMFQEFRKSLSPPSFDDDVCCPRGLAAVSGSEIHMQIKPQHVEAYGHGLQYLLNPAAFPSHMQKEALTQLARLVTDNLNGGWPLVLKDLGEAIRKEVSLEDCSGQVSVSSFSAALVKLIHTKVSVFVRDRINEPLAKFGLELDMDGAAAVHTFALLQSWRLLADGQRHKSMQNIREMQRDRDNWKKYFVSNVCAKPIEQSKAVAEYFVSGIVKNFLHFARSNGAESIKARLEEDEEEFNAKTIQAKLDDDLLFSGRGEEHLAVEYITNQTEYVTNVFEEQFGTLFNSLKDGVVLDTKRTLQKGLAELRDAFETLRQFLEKNNLQEAQSELLFSAGVEAIFELEKEETNVSAYNFIVSFCLAGDLGTYGRFKDLKDTACYVDIVTHRDTTGSTKGIPMLYHFCTEALDKIAEQMIKLNEFTWSIVDMGLDDLRASFKNRSIGCPNACPTCGRKCDQDVNDVAHKCGCSLGHQIRGMSGIRLENDFASTETCDEISDDRRILQEDSDMSWKESTWYEIKQQFPNWEYFSLDEKDARYERIVKFRKAWDIYGCALCKHYNSTGNPIKFREYQKYKEGAGGATHFIIILDESGSMCGERFENAKSGARTFIQKLFEKGAGPSRVSLVFFVDDYRVLCQEGGSEAACLLDSSGFRSGGTVKEIEAALRGAIHCIENSSKKWGRTVIVHYTDGGGYYPEPEVTKLKEMKETHGISYQYYAICEQTYHSVLQQVCTQFHPEDPDSHLRTGITPDGFGSALAEIMRS